MNNYIFGILYLYAAHFVIDKFNIGHIKTDRIQRQLLKKAPATYKNDHGHVCHHDKECSSNKLLQCEPLMCGLTMDENSNNGKCPHLCTYKEQSVQPGLLCTVHKECWHNDIIGDTGPDNNITYLCQKQSTDEANIYGKCEPSKWGEKCQTDDDCPYFMNGDAIRKLECLTEASTSGVTTAASNVLSGLGEYIGDKTGISGWKNTVIKLCRFPDETIPDKWQCGYDAECKKTKQPGTGYNTPGKCAKLTRGKNPLRNYLLGSYSDYGRCNDGMHIQRLAHRWEFSRVHNIWN